MLVGELYRGEKRETSAIVWRMFWRREEMRKTNLARLKGDFHLAGIGAFVKNRNDDLFVALVKFMSINTHQA